MSESIADTVTRWVGQALGLPCAYGEFPPVRGDRLMVKATPGSPVVKRYANGGGIYRFPYEVYLMTSAATEDKRLDGIATLMALADRIKARDVPDDGTSWTGHSVYNLPALFAENGGAESVYQLTAELTYLERG